MLFGSVARGQATACSDIDLVVLIDDLGDYRSRNKIKDQLTDAAEAVVEHPVHVHLSDLPEWRTRTEKVSASFEASLTDQLLPLLNREPRHLARLRRHAPGFTGAPLRSGGEGLY